MWGSRCDSLQYYILSSNNHNDLRVWRDLTHSILYNFLMQLLIVMQEQTCIRYLYKEDARWDVGRRSYPLCEIHLRQCKWQGAHINFAQYHFLIDVEVSETPIGRYN